VFGESLEILSMIDIGENKSWEIAQKLDVPIHRYRALIRRLVELRFIHYDDRDYSYSLTSRGDNVIKFAGSQICAPA
jgi:DNA-binding IclR family transcriptional regulator